MVYPTFDNKKIRLLRNPTHQYASKKFWSSSRHQKSLYDVLHQNQNLPVLKQTLNQLVFLISTVVITLYKDPLIGLLGGMAITLVAHLLISRVSIPQFIQMVVNSGTRLRENQDGSYTLKVKGVANFYPCSV